MGSVKTVRASSVPNFHNQIYSVPDFSSRRSSILAASSDENELINLFSKVRLGLASHTPEESTEGTGTVYILKDGSGEPAAVFKPYDEEAIPSAGADPHGLQIGEEIKPGLLYGEGYLKEVAAFLLDRDRFNDVPPTTIFIFSHPHFANHASRTTSKLGSLQKYATHKCSAEEIGWNMFPVNEVHRLGILDCRILNNDRHLGNILVAEGNNGFYRLIPIDHGLSLPSSLDGAYFEWLSFPQTHQPFDQKTLDYIEHLDPDQEVKLLKSTLPLLRSECLVTLKFCTYFLKKAARCKLNLYQIGCLMSRYLDPEEPCELSKLKNIVDAKAGCLAESDQYWRIVEEEMDVFFESWNTARDRRVGSVNAV